MHGTPSKLWEWQEQFNPPSAIETALCLPFTLLHTQPMQFKVGAQDVATFEGEGAYTGEISASMIKNMGVTYALCGHSERRHVLHENNEIVKIKCVNTINSGLTPILCIGEPLGIRKDNKENSYIEEQLKASLPEKECPLLIIAYEPVWAIGTGEVASLDQIASMHKFIASVMKGLAPTQKIAIVYGGSVNPDNARDIMTLDHVDGVLVGGASLDAEKFQRICEAAV